MARQGKIARLPHKLREEVNRRLLDGQTSRTILQWLNAKDEAVSVWEAHFEGAPANPQNLSEWRTGGYKEWLQRRQKTENLKTLASYANDLARAGGNISDGAAAIAAGHLLEALENAATDEDADLSKLTEAVTLLQTTSLNREKLSLAKRKESNKEKLIQLSREKFEKQTVEMFMKWGRSKEAQSILSSGKPKHVQMSLLRETIFGKRKGATSE